MVGGSLQRTSLQVVQVGALTKRSGTGLKDGKDATGFRDTTGFRIGRDGKVDRDGTGVKETTTFRENEEERRSVNTKRDFKISRSKRPTNGQGVLGKMLGMVGETASGHPNLPSHLGNERKSIKELKEAKISIGRRRETIRLGVGERMAGWDKGVQMVGRRSRKSPDMGNSSKEVKPELRTIYMKDMSRDKKDEKRRTVHNVQNNGQNGGQNSTNHKSPIRPSMLQAPLFTLHKPTTALLKLRK